MVYICALEGGIKMEAMFLTTATTGKGEGGIISPLSEGSIALLVSSFKRVRTVTRWQKGEAGIWD